MAVTHIFKTTVVKFGVRVQTWETLFQAKFCIKKSLKGVYPFGANLYQKLPNSAILGAASPHFKSDNGDIWREGTDLGHHHLRALFSNNRSGGFVHWEIILPKNRNFRDF